MHCAVGSKISPSSDYGVWVGFNDLNPFQPDSDTVICTGSKHWAMPPRLGEVAEVVAFDTRKQTGLVIGHTMAINYPIGSRPQCVLYDGEPFYVLNNIQNSIPTLDIYNYSYTRVSTIVGINHWCTTRNLVYSYCCDFKASHRLGGYGYVYPSLQRLMSYHDLSGSIYRYHHASGFKEQLISLEKAATLVATYLGISPSGIVQHSYLTHLLLSPNEQKLAFLYRFWLRDGGILTALLTADLDTQQSFTISIQLVGQLSHFTWLSDDELIIYAYQRFDSASLRIKLNSYSAYYPFVKYVKSSFKLLRSLQSFILSRSYPSSIRKTQNHKEFCVPTRLPCFIQVSNSSFNPFRLGLPASDGHPSVKSVRGTKVLISDTYPDNSAMRSLFAISIPTNSLLAKIHISEYRPRDLTTYKWVNRGSLIPKFASFPISDQSFTRSGLHCDAHPFFNSDGTKIGYHTSEDGFRTIKTLAL